MLADKIALLAVELKVLRGEKLNVFFFFFFVVEIVKHSGATVTDRDTI